jgi:hypothetical protein
MTMTMTMTTTAYRISNRTSGADLGVYYGTTPADAARDMRRDAGYATDEAAAEALGIDVDALDDELLIEAE